MVLNAGALVSLGQRGPNGTARWSNRGGCRSGGCRRRHRPGKARIAGRRSQAPRLSDAPLHTVIGERGSSLTAAGSAALCDSITEVCPEPRPSATDGGDHLASQMVIRERARGRRWASCAVDLQRLVERPPANERRRGFPEVVRRLREGPRGCSPHEAEGGGPTRSGLDPPQGARANGLHASRSPRSSTRSVERVAAPGKVAGLRLDDIGLTRSRDGRRHTVKKGPPASS